MKKLTAAIVTAATLLILSVGASFATQQADCCDSGKCCPHSSCCKRVK